MAWYWKIYQSVKNGQKSNYQYNIIENTSILHGPETLITMYDNANHEQKASIYKHICNFDMQTEEDYKDIANSIWDDYV